LVSQVTSQDKDINITVTKIGYDASGNMISMDEGRVWKTAGGGEIEGLDENWINGNVTINKSWSYYAGANLISGYQFSANGGGRHKDGQTQAEGIEHPYSQKDIKYNQFGTIISFSYTSAQWTKYEYSDLVVKALTKKVVSGTKFGYVETTGTYNIDSFDSFGRVSASHSSFFRNDFNQTEGNDQVSNIIYDSSGKKTSEYVMSATSKIHLDSDFSNAKSITSKTPAGLRYYRYDNFGNYDVEKSKIGSVKHFPAN